MTELHSIGKFKALKVVKRDLEELIRVVELNIRGLQNYKHYSAVAVILTTLLEQLDVLKRQLEQAKEGLKDKGKV